MAILIERTHHLDWLENNVKLSSLISISGLKGSGKSSFLRSWIQKRSLRAKWYTMHRFLPVASLLGFSQDPFESALEKAAESWDQYGVIIWDELHLLDPANRFLLMNFVRNTGSQAIHVFVSDEDHQEEFSYSVPHLKLGGFAENEFHSYLEVLGKKISSIEANEVYKTTGGFPHLVFLWAQGIDAKKGFQALGTLSPQATKVLLTLSSIQKPLTLDWLKRNIVGEFTETAVDEIVKKNFLQETPDGLLVPEFIRDLLVSSASQSDLQESQTQALAWLQKIESTKPFEFFVSALASQNQELLSQILLKIAPSDLESLPQRDLHQLEIWMNAMAEYISGEQLCRLVRLRIHGLVLQGRRKDAVKDGRDFAESIETDSEELLWLKYEVVQWMNRLGQFAESQKLLTDVIGKVQNPLKLLCRIEQSIPFVTLDPERALKGLLRVHEELLPRKNDKETFAMQAQTLFQIATSYNNLEELDSAASYYLQAQGLYETLGKFYFKAFCLFNRAWIRLNQRKFEELQSILSDLKTINTKFGYRYTQVGSDLIAAIEQFLNLRLTESLHQLSQVLASAKEVSAMQAQVDILIERARLLNYMGLESQAMQDFIELGKIPNVKNSKALKLLSLELNQKDLSVDEFRDQIQNLELRTSRDHIQCYLLERKIWPEELDDETPLSRSVRGQLALVQYRLLRSLESSDNSATQLHLQEFTQLLQKIKEPRPERVARDCLEAQLSQSPVRKIALLDRAEIELQIWNADPVFKLPLAALIRTLKDGVDVQNDQQWQSSRGRDRERWGLWVVKNTAKERFQLSTLKGKQKVDAVLAEHPKGALVIIEHLGKVLRGSKEMDDFHRRPILRQMLALLLEIYPSFLTKASLASAVWGDVYSPDIHDSRIYTSVQRLRTLLGEAAIENWEGGYRWNPNQEFYSYKPLSVEEVGGHKIKVLLLETLRKAKQSGRSHLGRAELVEASGSSESTVKRILSQLLQEGKIERFGKGPSVTYAIK